MSGYQQRDNSGSLFKNNRREKDTQPNATGKAMIGGVMFEVSAWTKTDRNGNPWQSLSFKKADEAARREHVEETRSNRLSNDLDDAVPF